MVAGTTVELLISIIPRWFGPNKLPINKMDIMVPVAAPITNTACMCVPPFTYIEADVDSFQNDMRLFECKYEYCCKPKNKIR